MLYKIGSVFHKISVFIFNNHVNLRIQSMALYVKSKLVYFKLILQLVSSV